MPFVVVEVGSTRQATKPKGAPEMVKVVRVPGFARDHFSANALSGWADGVQYSGVHACDDEDEPVVKKPKLRPAAALARRVKKLKGGRSL